MGKEKHLCKWEEDRIDKLDAYLLLVEKPKFLYESCGRVAARKKHLCKPLQFKGKE
ncbi:MAG: hypothetical protein ABIA59_01480 [Candidatus Latescibacterota bacterium]